MFQTKVVEKIKTPILGSITFFFENRAVYEIMWKNTVELGRPQMAILRMRIACWINKATNTHTHTQYVILVGFALQKWLQERTSMLRHNYGACLVNVNILLRCCYVHTRHWRGEYVGVTGVNTNVHYCY